MHYDAVFHLDQGQAELDIAFSNITNYLGAFPNRDFRVVLLVNGPGIKLMGRDSPNCSRLQELSAMGLSVRVCNNALKHFGFSADWLCPCCVIVPAGIIELVDLQRQGFAYIKP